MARLNNKLEPIGSKGRETFKKRGDIVYVSSKKDKRPGVPLTLPVITHDVKWPNGIQLWKAFRGELKYGFELEKPSQTQFNMFVKYYMENARVCFTKQQSEAGAQVLDHVYVSHGSLEPEVGTMQQSDSLVVTDICLGDLVIDQDTTVAQFTQALKHNNPLNGSGGVPSPDEARFQDGDQVMYYRGVQHPATEDQPAQVTISLRRVQLDEYQTEVKLWAITGRDGFTSHEVDGRQWLASEQAPYILSAYVQSRNVDRYRTLFTTQRMLGKNPLIEQYITPKALSDAIKSYGPIKPTNQFDPRTAPNAPQANSGTSGDGGNQGNTDPTYQLTVVSNPVDSATFTLTPEGPYHEGDQVQVRVTPKSGYYFSGWQGGGSQNPRTVTIGTTNLTLTANLSTSGGGGDL